MSTPAGGEPGAWAWPVEVGRYDRAGLSALEQANLATLGTDLLRRQGHCGDPELWRPLARLLRPLEDTQAALRWQPPPSTNHRRFTLDATGLVLLRCGQLGTAFWQWGPAEWAEAAGPGAQAFTRGWPCRVSEGVRPYLLAYAYLLGGFTDLHLAGRFQRPALAWRAFGRTPVEQAAGQVRQVLAGWGYHADDKLWTAAVCHLLLLNRSPYLHELTDELLARVRRDGLLPGRLAAAAHGVHRALAGLGHLTPPRAAGPAPGVKVIEGGPPGWTAAVERWYATSTLTPRVRALTRLVLAKAGRWLATAHPDITGPQDWTRSTCAAWVAAVDRMHIGDHVQRTTKPRTGEPLKPQTKAGYLRMTRAFFRDCQEWEWIPRRFDPGTALATPRTINALTGPDPRVIADDVWAKLLWAGLNLTADDLPATGRHYPLELVRAVTLTWLFSGQRSDEIARLRLGCIRWQHGDTAIRGDDPAVLARDAVCLLDVPTHKTGTAFTKPVDPLMGQAIEAWQALRPAQPATLDRKTGERVDFVFATRARPVDKTYINRKVIPMLCGKAGVPTADVRGTITSHRARSTIASQLYNAKEPMTLFELQAWLGHASPQTTQYYARITPNTLTSAYRDAGYFERNVRTIEVLLDRDAVTSGQATAGQPWQYYDLGHGLCSYTFFEQCPHRMACAKCDFYTPKGSTKAQLLEAKGNLQRMLAAVPLTDDERAAVDDGHDALDRLLERLTDVPTPAGPTPRQIGIPATATRLPIVDVRQNKSGHFSQA